jgi:hypothetical protein
VTHGRSRRSLVSFEGVSRAQRPWSG